MFFEVFCLDEFLPTFYAENTLGINLTESEMEEVHVMFIESNEDFNN